MVAATGPQQIGANLDRYDTAAMHPLGSVFESERGKAYRYVQFLDAVTYAAGHVVTRGANTADTWKVTNDRAGGSAQAGHEVIGVAIGVPTQNQFGWVQISGEATVLGTYAVGDQLKPHATTDGAALVSGYTAAAVDFNIFAAGVVANTTAKLHSLR